MTGIGDLNLKFPLILDISIFIISSLNFMLSRDEHEKYSYPIQISVRAA